MSAFRRIRKATPATALATAIVLALPALTAAAQQPPPQSVPEAVTLDEIVVTARKREENLQNIPLAVSAFAEHQLEARRIDSVIDVANHVPNVTLVGKSAGDFNPSFIIRGISAAARNVGFESALGVYVDGVFMGRTSAVDQDLGDATRVEVLRGPQGTLFGKNTIAGAINIVTAEPSATPFRRVSAEVGSAGFRGFGASISGPLVDERLLGKVSFHAQQEDGHVKNVNSAGTGPRTLDARKRWSARGGLKWVASDTLDVDLRADYSRKRGNAYDSEVLSGMGHVPGPRSSDVDLPGLQDRQLGGASVTATLDAGRHSFTSISGWRFLDFRFEQYDLDFTPLNFLYSNIDDRLRQYSQEFRMASDTDGRFSYVAGLYLFRQSADSVRQFGLGPDSGLPVAINLDSRVDTSSVALFANGDYRFTDQLSLNAGLRLTREEKDMRYLQSGGDLIGYPTSPASDSLTDNDHSVTLALNYTPTENGLLYLKYSTGFKSGGWNTDLIGSALPFGADAMLFAPESIVSYEAGYKLTALDRRLRLNIAAFHLQYKDIQVSQWVGGLTGFRTTNAAKATSQGVELELAFRPTRHLDLTASVGFNDAKYDEYVGAAGPGQDLSGTRLGAPRGTASLGLDYVRPWGNGNLIAGMDYTSRSRYDYMPLDPNALVASEDLVGARLGYRWASGLEIYAWSTNLLDRTYQTARGKLSNMALFGIEQVGAVYAPPRMVGIRLNYAF